MALDTTTAPTGEPVTVEELRDHLRVSTTDDDLLIENIGKAAREYAETFTRRQLMLATYTLHMDGWPAGDDPIVLPRPPLLSVTSVGYVDTDGTSQTVSTSVYTTDTVSDPGRVYLSYDQAWPTDTRTQRKAVNVVYTAGYSSGSTLATQRDAVPDAFKSAILILAGDLYEHREARLDFASHENPTVDRLLWSLRSFGDVHL